MIDKTNSKKIQKLYDVLPRVYQDLGKSITTSSSISIAFSEYIFEDEVLAGDEVLRQLAVDILNLQRDYVKRDSEIKVRFDAYFKSLKEQLDKETENNLNQLRANTPRRASEE